MKEDRFGVICRAECERCRTEAWAWANITAHDGYGNMLPPTCEAIDCAYCLGRQEKQS